MSLPHWHQACPCDWLWLTKWGQSGMSRFWAETLRGFSSYHETRRWDLYCPKEGSFLQPAPQSEENSQQSPADLSWHITWAVSRLHCYKLPGRGYCRRGSSWPELASLNLPVRSINYTPCPCFLSFSAFTHSRPLRCSRLDFAWNPDSSIFYLWDLGQVAWPLLSSVHLKNEANDAKILLWLENLISQPCPE